jgi:Domain of unknown function DUF29
MVLKDTEVLPELYEQDETAWLERMAQPVESLAKVYANGLKQARFDTGAAATAFPAESPYNLDALLADDWSEE